MNHSDPELYFFVAAMRLSCAMLLNKQRRKLLWFLHNYPLKTALQVIFQRILGYGVQSPIKANGSKSVRGRQHVPAKVLYRCAKRESAAAGMHPVPLRARPGSAAASSLAENVSWSYLNWQVLTQLCGERKSALLPAVLLALCILLLIQSRDLTFSGSYFQECLPVSPLHSCPCR